MLTFDIYSRQRGAHGSSISCNILFTLLRLSAVPLQFFFLSNTFAPQLLEHYSIAALRSPYAKTSVDALPMARYYLLLFVSISAFKHVFWAWYLLQAPLTLATVILLCCINYSFDTLNTLLYLCVSTTPTNYEEGITRIMIVGGILLLIGAAVESVSEWQRRTFKAKQHNDRKVFTGGLFQYARHINYTGFTVYRLGATMLSGGWVAGTLIAACHFVDFAARAVPVLDAYCKKKYGSQWKAYKAQTRASLVPGIF